MLVVASGAPKSWIGCATFAMSDPSDRDPKDEESEKRDAGSIASLRSAAENRVSSPDPRAHAAWRTWLTKLATSAEAATAAALAYESLSDEGRVAWLDALDSDAPTVEVPKVALFAPLLAVEEDEGRRERIAKNVTDAAKRSEPPRALVGRKKSGERVCLVVSPLYLDFVELLVCRYTPTHGVHEARSEWLVHKDEVTMTARELGVPVSDEPLPDVVEELAHAVLADRRAGRAAPDALMRYIDLFGP